MIFGSHNSLTYLKPTCILSYLYRITWRCQNIDIQSQYNLGVRCFDFRLTYYKNTWYAAHGFTKFKVDFDSILSWLNSQNQEQVYIRVVLEHSSEIADKKFIDTCNEWIIKYPNLKFFEGVRKHDWKQLFHFSFTPNIFQFISSMQESNIIKKILPIVYAKKYNKVNYEIAQIHDENQICLFDFVNINCHDE